MPLANVRTTSSERFGIARATLSQIKNSAPPPGSEIPVDHHIQKSLFIILLYAAWEFTVTKTVTETANIIGARSIKRCDLSMPAKALALDPQLTALSMQVSRENKWRKRLSLFENEFSTDYAKIYESALVSELGNIWPAALKQVFEAFGFDEDPFREQDSQGRLHDLVNKRNGIAHGRESPIDVGRSYTESSLEVLFSKIELLKEITISRFEQYIIQHEYVAQDRRADYI